MEIVVLGMHSGGTSCMAAVLVAMGVPMYEEGTMMGPVKGYPTHEDSEFVALSANLLRVAGGNWWELPVHEEVMALGADKIVRRAIELLLAKKRKAHGDLWGWKDPRTALTIPLYHYHLVEPLYIVVVRDARVVAQSLVDRGLRQGDKKFWRGVALEYYARIDRFLMAADPLRMVIPFEDLLRRDYVEDMLYALADLIFTTGDIQSRVGAGMGAIRFKES